MYFWQQLLTRWRHQKETFSALLALCAGNSPVTGEFPSKRPVTRSFDNFFDLQPNKRLCKQSGRRWFETISCSLWRHCNVAEGIFVISQGYIFYDPPPQKKKGILWLIDYRLFLKKKSLNKGLFELKFIKIMSEWTHDQEILLSQGYVFDEFFLSRSKITPLRFFSEWAS